MQQPRAPPQRKQKTLIVGRKTGITAFLAKLAHVALVVLRALPKLGLAFTCIQLASSLLLPRLRGRALFASNTLAKRIAFAYLYSEAGFYLAMLTRQELLLQRQERERVPELTISERRILFARCMEAIPPRTFLEHWFEPIVHMEELKRDNVLDLLTWAFFHKKQAELTKLEREEAALMLESLEREVKHTFAPGRNLATDKLSFTETKVEGKHRSWLIYFTVDLVFQRLLAPFALRVLRGYSRHRCGDLTYWYKPGSDSNAPPLVFLHGIGVGILPYLGFLSKLEQQCAREGRAILIPEIQAISQRLFPDELHVKTFASDLNQALVYKHGHDRAHFLGHSYGTFCATWMVKFHPELVAGLGLIDPVSLLLHSVDVVHNIVFHEPLDNSVEYTLDYILRGEVALVHNIKRQFFWFQNILFLEQVPTKQVPVFVCLGDTDQLVPVEQVRDYCNRYNAGQLLHSESAKENGQVDLLWFDRCDHAGFLFNKEYTARVAGAVERMCGKVVS